MAAGIGLHNLGEGVAIGSAYAVGALALGAFLVVGFALHNTTEGLRWWLRSPRPGPLSGPGCARARGGRNGRGRRLDRRRGLLQGSPLLFGFGAGAIVQVIVQLTPTHARRHGRTLHPVAVGGLLAGMALMFATGLLVSV